eukprot:TRINITY_DN102185_c0_g1_i1.p1 TRINITY_DN102185_c0_g1~~TRINITY_DN102185_c0_g1_i1.p1  ORF type:complete len:262 (-),score=71.83 TRINITY_DN102185_c0_g1_i1:292-1077(-)
MTGAGPTKLPPGILPPGVNLPRGTDIMQFCRDLAESGAEFAEQFERDNPKYHNGITTEVPLGGARIPDSMKAGAETENWRDMPEAPLAIEEDFGPEYDKAMADHKRLNDCKRAISVLNKPVEMVMKLRVQYKGSENEDRTAWEGRLKGAENDRDGAIAAAIQTIKPMDDDVVSERTRSCVQDVETRGKFDFIDKETFGEYMQVLQRANQAIFADQKKLLAKIKEIKKNVTASMTTTASPATGEGSGKGGYVAESVPAVKAA